MSIDTFTDPSDEKSSVYSSVVSLRGISIITFLAELNGLESWCTDISCAYLESYTQEKVYIVAGPEFGSGVIYIGLRISVETSQGSDIMNHEHQLVPEKGVLHEETSYVYYEGARQLTS